MAAIIQEGQMSAPIQGGLFQGKSFWLSARVPMRSRYVQLIKANGGSVVLGEKDADILIVDHLKDHSGDTAFSYQFIEKSIENRQLEDLDDHRVSPVQKKKKSKATGLKGRNNFTQEDDEILFKKLVSVDSGYNGNKIYQELYEKYPHHTMHGWRGRWVDHFSKLKDSSSKLERLRNKRDQMEAEEESEQLDLTASDEDPEVTSAKNGMDTFTKEDEAILQKMAVELLKSSGDMIYEKLSKRNPRHTPKQWCTYFNDIMLPRIAHRNTMNLSDESGSEPKGRHDGSEDEGQPIARVGEGKIISRSARGIGETLEPASSSLDLKRKKLQPPVSTKSPLRTMSVRDSPRHWSKEGNKTLADLQTHKSATNSPTGQIKSTTKDGAKAVEGTVTTEIPENPLQQTQQKRDGTDKGKSPEITPLSHDNAQSDMPQYNQKRKREKKVFTPEQRKRKRNFHDVIESTPEAESATQSRALSPELGQSSQKSSLLVIKNKEDKRYGEMGTQALYDQLDKEELLADMEFPELELPGTPTSSHVASPSPPKENSTPPSKPLPKTPASAWKSSPTSPKDDDSNSITEISIFLDYCQDKFRTSEQKVIDAIERTNGVQALVEVILECDVLGQAPPDLPGIWTREQDQILLGADSKVIKKLAEIKGEEQMSKRMEFLNMWNRA